MCSPETVISPPLGRPLLPQPGLGVALAEPPPVPPPALEPD
ncbi:MAG TPA: hypothetical protein VGP93_02245 [Polyangiaceae bacterium]|nr:hypothetical protein [Polyangiaceae bacterium]